MMGAQTYSAGSAPPAQTYSAGGMMDGGSGGSLQGVPRMANADPVTAALMHLQSDPGPRAGLQAAIDAGPAPPKFTPLTLPPTAPSMPGAAGAQQRISGLQRLLQERFG